MTDNVAGSTLWVDGTSTFSLSKLTIPDNLTNHGTIRLETTSNDSRDCGSYLTIVSGRALTNSSDGIIESKIGQGDERVISGRLINEGAISVPSGLLEFVGTLDAAGGTYASALVVRDSTLHVLAGSTTPLHLVGGNNQLLTDNVAGSTLWIDGTNAYGRAVLTVPQYSVNHGTIRLESSASSNSDNGSYLATAAAVTLTNASDGVIDVRIGTGYARALTAPIYNEGTIRTDTSLTIGRTGAAHVNRGIIALLGGTTTFTGTSLSNKFGALIGGFATLNTAAVSFTNQGTVDLTRPSVIDVKFDPALIQVTFSDAMNQSTVVNPANYSLLASGGDGVFGNGNDADLTANISGITWDTTSRVASLALSSALASDDYLLTLQSPSIKNSTGTALFATPIPILRGLGTIPTQISLDLLASSDSGVSDSDNLTNDNTPTFSVAVNKPGTISLDLDDDGAADLSLAVDSPGTYSLTAPTLTDGARLVRATLAPLIGDTDDATLALRIDTQSPTFVAGAATEQAPADHRQIQFSEPIAAAIDLASHITITGPGNTSVPLTGLTGAGDTFTATFAPLVAPGDYVVAADQTIHDLAGNPFAPSAHDDFTLLADVTPPEVVSASPVGLRNSNLSLLRVTFSETIDTATFTGSDVIISGPSGTLDVSSILVTATDAAHRQFEISIPTQSADGDYFAALGPDIRDLAGNPLDQSYEFGFTIDKTSPAIVSQSPASLASAPLTQITFTYDESLRTGNVSLSEVSSFTGPDGGSLRSQIRSVSATGDTLTVTFDEQTAEGTYTIVVGPSIEDLAGNPMAASYTGTVELHSPDLQVLSVSTPLSATLGDSLTVHWTVRNQGIDPARQAWSDRVYLSHDANLSGDDTLLLTQSASAHPLAAGAQYEREAQVTLPLSAAFDAGDYYILVATDALSQQQETDESNNFLASIPVAIAVPPIPDLVVSAISASVEAIAGQKIQLSWTITNQGTADATGNWTDVVSLSTDAAAGSDQTLKSFPFSGTIHVGESITRTQLVTIPEGLAGDHWLVVTTDATNDLFEHKFDDNNATADDQPLNIVAAPSPNLVVESITSPNDAFSSQSISLDWVIKNVGTGSTNSAGWVDRVYLSLDSTLDLSDTLLGTVENASYLNPGDSYQSTLTATLPQGISGNYRLLVRTDATGKVSEAGGEDDNVSVSPQVSVSLTPPPDLVVSLIIPPSLAFSGLPAPLGWKVENQGPGRTRQAQWSDQVYISFGDKILDSGDQLLATVSHDGELQSGEDYEVAGFYVTLPLIGSGEAYFIVRTDSASQVFEHSSEGNNVAAQKNATTVFQTPPPDLTVTSISVPAEALAGQPLLISYTVVNQDVTATPNNSWSDSIYLSSDAVLSPATDHLLGVRRRTGTLDAGQSETLSYSFQLSDTLSGDFHVIVSTDSLNQVFEADNANNVVATSSTTRVTVNPPDLSLTLLSVSPAPRSGRDLTVEYAVANVGAAPTPLGAWSDAIYLSADEILDSDDRRLTQVSRYGVLAPDAAESHSVVVRLPADQIGAFYLFIVADVSHSLYELSEANNVASTPLTIVEDRPDLLVRSFDARFADSTILPGSSVAIDFAVDNVGGSTRGVSWIDRLILSEDDIAGNADDRTVGEWRSPSALAERTGYSRQSVNAAIPRGVPAGNYHLFLIADVTNLISEVEEANNASGPIPVSIVVPGTGGTPVSDLQVTSLTVPVNGASGGTLAVAWTIANLGTGATNATSWTDTVWLSQDESLDSSDIKLGPYSRASGLAPGASYSRAIDATLPVDLAGTYFVIVQTDSEDRVDEGAGESNNSRVSAPATSIALSPSPDLTVLSVTPPTTIYSGQPATFEWTVGNTGAGSATGTWFDTVYLSLDQFFDLATDIRLGGAERPTALNPGQLYSGAATLTVPKGLGGLYYVFVQTDTADRTRERNAEDNNVNYAPHAVNLQHVPQADLVVGSISIPATATPGQSATISYTIHNNSTKPANGSWSDALFLSADSRWDLDDPLFGRVSHVGGVPMGSSYSESLTAPMPGVLPGNYQVIVRSDIRNQLVESNETNNLAASLDGFAVDVAQLTLGVPNSGFLEQNGAAYYQVAVKTGDTLLIEYASDASEGFTEFYASFGTLPSRSHADFSAIDPFRQDQRILVPIARKGVYYVLAYGADIPGESTPFQITARTITFSVLDTDFGGAANVGRATVEITGAKLTGKTTAQLLLAGATRDAVSYWRPDTSKLFATFDLAGAPLGRYDLRLSDPNGGSITVPASFEVHSGHAAAISAKFSGASTVQRGATHPVAIEVSNTGDVDGYAPLITLSSERVGTPFGISPDDMRVQTIQFLGIRNSGPAGIYAAHETDRTNLDFRADANTVGIDMKVITAEDTTIIDWPSLKDSLRIRQVQRVSSRAADADSDNAGATLGFELFSYDAWTPIFDNLTSHLVTWGDYVVMLNENATYLSQLGQRVSDVQTLWSFEIQQAMNRIGPVQTLATAVDAAVQTAGLSLELSRSFSIDFVSRYSVGLFGRGWATVWDTSLKVDGDGTIGIYTPAGLTRQFVPKLEGTGFISQAGDSGTLEFINDAWQIRESSGGITAFRSDGRLDYFQDVNHNRVSATYTAGLLTRLTHTGGQFLEIEYRPALIGAAKLIGYHRSPSRVTDSAGRSTVYDYDFSGNQLLSVTTPDGTTTTYTYDTTSALRPQAVLLEVTAAGLSYFYSYDNRGRLQATSRNGGTDMIRYSYDNAGRINISNNLGTTSLFYDARGGLTRSEDPFGHFTTVQYSDDHRTLKTTDSLGEAEEFTWDIFGSLTSTTNQLGNTTDFAYDSVGDNLRRLVSFTDANGNVTHYTYDRLGNRTSTIYADGSVERITSYDSTGKPLSLINRRGQLLSYTYNLAGQVTRETLDDGSYIAFTYDAHGNLFTVIEPDTRVTTYEYDTGDRLIKVAYPEGWRLHFTYDSAGRRTSMSDHTGFHVLYFYNNDGRLSRISDAAMEPTVSYSYDLSARLIGIVKRNGTYSRMSYDQGGRLSELVNYAPDATVSTSFSYTYDIIGRRTSETTLAGR
ncbi:MAG: CARDB domain-containing protein [Planctomycetales bacterium]